MSYRIVPRREIGLPEQPTNNNGSPRPAMAKGREGLTLHYVGAGAFRNRQAIEAILAIDTYARSPQKMTPFEYNFMIGQADDDLLYEYAGFFRAAHSAKNNASFFGVCLLNGVSERPTTPQMNKVRWLLDRLKSDGWIKSGGTLVPHRKMPGQVGATSCPGDLLMARFADFARPWSAAAPSPESEPEPEPERLTDPQESAPPRSDGLGHHLVRDGETSGTIARLHYGSVERSTEIDAANGDVAPIAGRRWKVPGIDGVWVTVGDGWGAYSCIRAAGFPPSAAAVTRFWRWNGGDADAGERGPLLAGEEVWVEDMTSDVVGQRRS